MVYLFSASSVAWAEAQYDDVAETLLFLRNIDSLSNVILTAGGRETDFALEHFPDASEKDDQMKVTADGQQYDTDNFRNLYQVLMSIYRKGAAPAEPAGDPGPFYQAGADHRFRRCGGTFDLQARSERVYRPLHNRRDLRRQCLRSQRGG